MKVRERVASLMCVLCVAAGTACSQPREAVFEFASTADVKAPTFMAKATDEKTIAAVRAELAKLPSDRSMHIAGPLERGDGGVNAPWSWHFTPDKWSLAEKSMELCDGTPQYVEEHLDAWLKDVGTYCPWKYRASSERAN
jgi:hypothetical protein